MLNSNHRTTCRCGLHAAAEARRHHNYRQLAMAILGPLAPQDDDLALAQALAEHAGLATRPHAITRFRPRRAA